MKYLIWSFEHRMWWAPDRCGYTTEVEKAGRYTATEAGEIVIGSVFGDEIAVAEPLLKRNGDAWPQTPTMPPKYHPYKGEVRPLSSDY